MAECVRIEGTSGASRRMESTEFPELCLEVLALIGYTIEIGIADGGGYLVTVLKDDEPKFSMTGFYLDEVVASVSMHIAEDTAGASTLEECRDKFQRQFGYQWARSAEFTVKEK